MEQFKNLTSANFAVEDIIFSDRIYMQESKVKYSVAGMDYLDLKNNVLDLLVIKQICGKYSKCKDFPWTSRDLRTGPYVITGGQKMGGIY